MRLSPFACERGWLYLALPLLECRFSESSPPALLAVLMTSPSPSPAGENGWGPPSLQDHLWVLVSPLLSPTLEVEEHLRESERERET